MNKKENMIPPKHAPFTRLIMVLVALSLMAVTITAAAHARPSSEPAQPAAAEQTARIYLPATLYGRMSPWSENSIFGVQVYNDSRPSSRYHSALIDSGATWLRVAVYWGMAEPVNTTPAGYTWSYADMGLAAALPATGGGVRVIGTIENAPPWALLDITKPDGPLKPGNLADFQEFVGALVERYDGDGFQDAPGSPIVDYWELYNEPDRILTTTDGRWGNHPTEYAAMLAAIYPVVKSRNPRAQVLLGGLAYDFFEDQGGPFSRTFLDGVLAAGGGNHFDIFNFHTYPSFAHNWLPAGQQGGGTGLLQKSKHLEDKLAKTGLIKPMFITEAGWHSNSTPTAQGSEEIQARYVVQLFTQSLAAGIDSMIWWMLFDPGEGGWDNGLVTTDNPPHRKQSFYAYQTLVKRMTGKAFVRTLSDGETTNPLVEAYQFRDTLNGSTHYMAWLNPVATNNTTLITLNAEEVRLIDIYGTPLGTVADGDDGADDGRVRVTLTGRPAYIEVTR